MEEIEWGAFAFGFILGAVITALAISKSVRKGFKSLFVGVWEKLFKKGGGKIALVALPYWLEWRLVVVLIVGGFLFVIWKDKNLKAIPEFFKGAYERLRDMLIYRIEDREAYDANKEQREADEAYKKKLKEKK
jgi:hypothetical protein